MKSVGTVFFSLSYLYPISSRYPTIYPKKKILAGILLRTLLFSLLSRKWKILLLTTLVRACVHALRTCTPSNFIYQLGSPILSNAESLVKIQLLSAVILCVQAYLHEFGQSAALWGRGGAVLAHFMDCMVYVRLPSGG